MSKKMFQIRKNQLLFLLFLFFLTSFVFYIAVIFTFLWVSFFLPYFILLCDSPRAIYDIQRFLKRRKKTITTKSTTTKFCNFPPFHYSRPTTTDCTMAIKTHKSHWPNFSPRFSPLVEKYLEIPDGVLQQTIK